MLCVSVFSASFFENFVRLFISVGRSLPEKGKEDDAYYAEMIDTSNTEFHPYASARAPKSRPETVVLA